MHEQTWQGHKATRHSINLFANRMPSIITAPSRQTKPLPVRAALTASLISIILHTGIWQAWQDLAIEPKPEEKPPLIVEVALTTAPSTQPVATPPPAAAQPTPPKPIPPAPKPLPPKPEKPKPKIPAKPKPVAKPLEPKKITPPTEPKPQQTQPTEAVKSTPSPTPVTAPAPPTPAPAKPNPAPAAAPAPEALVKALYSAPGLKNPPTRYPRLAQMRHLEGDIKLQVRVLANGSAGEIRVLQSSGHSILDDSAIEQVKSWRFIPAHKGKNTVDDWVIVPISFKFQH